MPQDVKAQVGDDAPATDAPAVQTFSREEVEAIVAESRREWQGRFTKATQELASERRANGELTSRLSAVEARLMQAPATDDSDDDDASFEEEWESIDTGRKLLKANKKLIRREFQRLAGTAGSDSDLASGALRRAEEVAFDRDLDRLRTKYRGMTDEQVRQMMELGVSTGNADLDYLAFKAFGPPETFVPGGDDGAEPDIERAIRARTKQRVLAGASKVAATTQTPQTVKVRRGIDGYSDVEGAALRNFKQGR